MIVEATTGGVTFTIKMDGFEFLDLCGQRSELITQGAISSDHRSLVFLLLTQMENEGRSLKNKK